MDFQKRVYIEIKRFGVRGKVIKHSLDYKKKGSIKRFNVSKIFKMRRG